MANQEEITVAAIASDESESHSSRHSDQKEDIKSINSSFGRFFSVSDLHSDHDKNWQLIEEFSELDVRENDVLIVAGDISSRVSLVKSTIEVLKQTFQHIFFVPGNNELRLSRREHKFKKYEHSVKKFEHILGVCEEMGIYTSPRVINDVWVVPLFGWYTPHFESSFDGDDTYKNRWLDFRRCLWPKEFEEDEKCSEHNAARYFADLNTPRISKVLNQQKKLEVPLKVITFSHFLPRRDLLARRAVWNKKSIAFVTGDPSIDEQLRSVGSSIHVFGHTHMNSDNAYDGVRYVQHAMGHPAERWSFGRKYRPKLIFDSTK